MNERSFMNMIKNIEPKIDSWGTPCLIYPTSDKQLPTKTW